MSEATPIGAGIGGTATAAGTERRLPRLAVFGTGWGASVHIPAFRAAGFEVTAVWARTQQRADKIAQDLSVPFASANITEVLIRRDVDFVSVVTPPHLHAEIAVKALSAGKHVLADKPTALSAAEAQRMLKAAQYYPRLLSIMDHELRFLPSLRRMRDLIAEGYIGTILAAEVRCRMGLLATGEYNWFCDEALGGGVLNAIGTHMIDALAFVTGMRALSVCGQLRTYVRETEQIHGYRYINSDDYCSFQLRLPQSVLCSVVINSHCAGEFEQELCIIGSRGRLTLAGLELHGCQNALKVPEVLVSKQDVLNALSRVVSAYRPNPHAAALLASATTPDGGISSPYVVGTSFLVDAVRSAFLSEQGDMAVPHAATFSDGLYVQTVVDAIKKSSHKRAWVDVKVETLNDTDGPFWT